MSTRTPDLAPSARVADPDRLAALEADRARGGAGVATVTGVLQPLACGDAAGDYTVTRSPAVRSCPLGEDCPYCLDKRGPMARSPAERMAWRDEEHPYWDCPTGRTARNSGAACGARATRSTGPKGRPRHTSPGSELVRLLPSAAVLSHPQIHVAGVILAVIVTAVTAALLASASPPAPARAATAREEQHPGQWQKQRLEGGCTEAADPPLCGRQARRSAMGAEDPRRR
jgi:hypothetical protein